MTRDAVDGTADFDAEREINDGDDVPTVNGFSERTCGEYRNAMRGSE